MSQDFTFKHINELPIMEAQTEQTNIVVEDNGETKRIPASSLVPENMATTEDLAELERKIPTDTVTSGQLKEVENKIPTDHITEEQLQEYLNNLSIPEDKVLIVINTDGETSHTGAEICDAINNGKVVFLRDDKMLIPVHQITSTNVVYFEIVVPLTETVLKCVTYTVTPGSAMCTKKQKTIKMDDYAKTDHVHKWDDLEGKPFGEIDEFIETVSERTATVDSNGYISLDSGEYNPMEFEDITHIKFDGQMYKLKYDTSESSVEEEGEEFYTYTYSCLSEDTGYPFDVKFVYSDYDEAWTTANIRCYGDEPTHTIAFYANEKIVKKLDEKFLPTEQSSVKEFYADFNEDGDGLLYRWDQEALEGEGDYVQVDYSEWYEAPINSIRITNMNDTVQSHAILFEHEVESSEGGVYYVEIGCINTQGEVVRFRTLAG